MVAMTLEAADQVAIKDRVRIRPQRQKGRHRVQPTTKEKLWLVLSQMDAATHGLLRWLQESAEHDSDVESKLLWPEAVARRMKEARAPLRRLQRAVTDALRDGSLKKAKK